MQQQNTELFKWYIIHTHSGFEAKVINNIKEEIKKKMTFPYGVEEFLTVFYRSPNFSTYYGVQITSSNSENYKIEALDADGNLVLDDSNADLINTNIIGPRHL